MSVVAARLYCDGFEMASDSITLRGSTQTPDNKRHSKLWERGPLVIGGCGTGQENGLMRLFSENDQPESATERGLLAFMGEFCDWKKKRTDLVAMENHFLIGYEQKIFHTEGFQVNEILTYESIGAGLDFALAAMKCGADPKAAVQIAIDLSAMCAAPVIAISKRGTAL